ncbi:MAG TPA: PQQ-binding-like beta-propeller repeat protein, partial [Cyclobacteriaceae bacterium]|nr:PQQ-binding-like beta-propeller repeat protein [Cyclobacteriaceae bacterium]
MKGKLKNSFIIVAVIGLLVISLTGLLPKGDDEYSGWAFYAGSNSGNRYSSGDQITKKNVSQLQQVWAYDSKDSTGRGGAMPTNPIVVDGILFGVSPQMNLFAVDAATGKEKWVFKPTHPESRGSIRGLSFWKDENGTDKRIIYASGAYMYQVNAADGKIVKSFGENGALDLRKDIDVDEASPNASVQGNSAVVIYKDMMITGMRVSEGTDALPGHIRGLDVRTGKRVWIFHTIPHPGEPGYETWEDKDAWKRVGGANNWAGITLDEKRGIVYIPTGSATPDFFGGNRLGANLYANSLIALDAATGKYIWHFQVVHHDMWDR